MFLSKKHALSNKPVVSPSTEAYQQHVHRSRQALALFLLLVTAISIPLEIVNIINDDAISMFLLMWTPGACALALRLVRKEGLATSSFQFHNKRTQQALLLGLLTPLAIGLIAYGLAWGLKLTPLVPYNAPDDVSEVLPFLGTNPSTFLYIIFAFLVIAAEFICAAGEELGWRGYMLPHLMQANVPQPILLSGIIWSLWHWPLILFEPVTNSIPTMEAAAIFLVTITALGCISAYLRLKTGSIWPSIILHTAWNCWILETFDAFTTGAQTSIWTSETGLLVALTTLTMAVIYAKFARPATTRTPVKQCTA